MPSVNYVQQHTKKDGTAQIYIRVIDNRKIIYHKTGYYVKPSQFKNGRVVNHVDAKMINLALEAQRSKIMAKYYQADINGEQLDELTLHKAIYNKLIDLEKAEKVATYRRLLYNFNIIKQIFPNDIKLSKITPEIVDKYIAFRRESGNGNNTIKKNLKDLSGVLTYAGFRGVDYFYSKATTLKTIPPKKDKLTPDEIKILEEKKLDGYYDLARDMWLFSYYIHGARFESVATFRREYIKGNVLSYQMNKGLKYREIVIHKKLKSIIDKYINNNSIYLFPLLKKEVKDKWSKKEIVSSANAMINRYLKFVIEACGINKKISFHNSRHSFASVAYESGVHTDTIKEALGHTNISTTNAYLKSLSDKKINDEINKIYE